MKVTGWNHLFFVLKATSTDPLSQMGITSKSIITVHVTKYSNPLMPSLQKVSTHTILITGRVPIGNSTNSYISCQSLMPESLPQASLWDAYQWIQKFVIIFSKPDVITTNQTQDSFCGCVECSCYLETNNFGLGDFLLSSLVPKTEKKILTGFCKKDPYVRDSISSKMSFSFQNTNVQNLAEIHMTIFEQ